MKPWDCYDGKEVWYRPNLDGKRYRAVISGEPRKLGECHVVQLRDVERSYGVECHSNPERTWVKAASLDAVDARDMIDELCTLVKEAGLTMRFNGQPVSADELRGIAMDSASERIVDLLTRKP